MTSSHPCDAFRKNADGSWTSIETMTISGVEVGPGVTFRQGVPFKDLDLATWLDQNCSSRPD
jgi:hypothetical protein